MRPDLLALTSAALSALANAGLVKRAVRELAEGQMPKVTESKDKTVSATFDDGAVASLPEGVPLKDGRCSCGAAGVCRHRIALVLAYQAKNVGAAEAPKSEEVWSPADFTDAELEKALGPVVFGRAKGRLEKSKVVVELTPGSSPSAKLPSCTVQFLVPRALSHARCDCVEITACEHIALAAWAFRAAGAQTVVALGRAAAASAVPEESFSAVTALLAELINRGAVGTGADAQKKFALARAEAAGSLWVAAAIDELEQQLEAYRARGATYSAKRFAELLAEVAARVRAGRGKGELPPAFVLGRGEAPETLLDSVRLISLGARVRADGDSRTASVYLADPSNSMVLVAQKQWASEAVDSVELGKKQLVSGMTLSALANGQLISKTVKRHANLGITLSARGQSSLTPHPVSFAALNDGLRVTDFAAFATTLAARPPKALRPRVLADGLCVLQLDEVTEVSFDAGEQKVTGRVSDGHGHQASVWASHESVTPGRLAAFANALNDSPKFICGHAHLTPHGLSVEAIGVASKKRFVAIDFAEPKDLSDDFVPAAGVPVTVIGQALAGVTVALQDLTHFGLAGVKADGWAALADATARVGSLGLTALAMALGHVTKKSGAEAWLSAAIATSCALAIVEK